jgi:5'-nucleotidase (lipoprotein e(P4) family)
MSAPGWGGVLGGIGLVAGLVIGLLAGQTPPPNPQERGLDANLWMQTAGEYRACCLQTYRLAWERLEQKVKEARDPNDKRPLAIVMDLDETVLDNSGFQTRLYANSLDYSDSLWEEWEKNHANEVRLVPGARAFIEKAEKAGVIVVYLSNRSEKNRAGTIAALEHVKLNTANIDKRLFLLKGPGGDKTERRKEAAKRYRVLMLFGDNLRDFDERFKSIKVNPDNAAAQNEGIVRRLELVDKDEAHWGEDWIILPNPVYGEWQRLIGRRPLENMRFPRQEGP